MDLDLSGPETSLLERLLNERKVSLASGRGNGGDEEMELIDRLLRKITHPMRGGIDQSESALLSDIEESIAPEIPPEKRQSL